MKLQVVIVNHWIADPTMDDLASPAPVPRDVAGHSAIAKGFHI